MTTVMSTRLILSCYVIIRSLEFSHSQSLFNEDDFRCEARRYSRMVDRIELNHQKIKVLENQISSVDLKNQNNTEQNNIRISKLEEKTNSFANKTDTEQNNIRISKLEEKVNRLTNKTDSVHLMGKEFYLVFPPLFVDDGHSYCVLYVVSIEAGFCTVALPLLSKNYTLELKHGENQLFLPASYMALENQLEGKGVHIECDVFVNVYAAKHDKYTKIAFLVLPIHSRFHYEYQYVPSVQPNPVSVSHASLYNSTLSIVSSGDYNIVQINLNLTEEGFIRIRGQDYAYNESIELAMNKYESVVISHFMDLTGSRISSIDPISVATGNKCGRLHESNACNGMNFMIPLDNSRDITEYDSEHRFTTPFFSSFLRGYKIRIVSGKRGYRLQYKLGNKDKLETIFVQSDYIDIDVDSNVPVYIRTSRFVSVTVITPGKNNTDGIGTAFMLYIPEERTLLTEYHFAVPDLSTTSFITVIDKNVSNIRLDDKTIDGEIQTLYDVNADPYEVVALAIQPGYHVISNILQEPFSVYVYGKQKPNLGYGYVAGFKVRK